LGVAGRRRWKLHGATGLGRLGGVGRSKEGTGVGCPEACRNARESLCAFSIRTEELMEFCLSSFFWLKIIFFLVKILLFLYSANGIKGKSRKNIEVGDGRMVCIFFLSLFLSFWAILPDGFLVFGGCRIRVQNYGIFSFCFAK